MTLPDFNDPERIALFLDFDGTLVAIANRPQDVRLDAKTRDALGELNRILSGALAIITGREIAAIDGFLAPLRLAVAGVHGLTRRDARGRTHLQPVDADFTRAVERALLPLLNEHPDLLVERKHGAVALHYRDRPQLERECIRAMEDALAELPSGIELKRGKMVVEAKMFGGNKGEAIVDYLREAPFMGRRPVFAGDDLTDEDGFVLVNQRGGVSIKVGSGETAAAHRVESTAEFLAWLRALPSNLSK